MCDLAQIILNYPHLTRADLAVYAVLAEIGLDAYQEDIAIQAGIKVRQVKSSIKALEQAKLLEVIRYYDKKSGKTRNQYGFINMQESAPYSPTEVQKSAPCSPTEVQESAFYPPKNGAKCRNVHPMNELNEEELGLEEIKTNFHFLDEPWRSDRARLPHVTLAFAGEWQEWWGRRQYTDWRGNPIENPASWASDQIRRGHSPPQQLPLPDPTYEASVLLCGESPEKLEAIKANQDRIIEFMPPSRSEPSAEAIRARQAALENDKRRHNGQGQWLR